VRSTGATSSEWGSRNWVVGSATFARYRYTPNLLYVDLSVDLGLLIPQSIHHTLLLEVCIGMEIAENSKKASPYSIAERRVPELIPVLGSQPAGDVSHKPGVRLPLLSARPAVTLATLEGCYQFRCLVNRDTMGVNSLPKTVTRYRCGFDLNPSPSAPQSSTLSTRLPIRRKE